MANKTLKYGNKIISLGGNVIRPGAPVQDGLVIWVDPANRKSVPADFHISHQLSCLVSGRTSSFSSPVENGIVEGNFLKSEPGTFAGGSIQTARLAFNFDGDDGLSATFSNSSFSIEEWYLVTDQNYPETFCGGSLSQRPSLAGNAGLEWNHGQQNGNYTRITYRTQPTDSYTNFYLVHLPGYGQADVWNHRVIVVDRDLDVLSLYLDGDFQASSSVANMGDDILYNASNGGTALEFGTVQGWTHEGKRGPTRVYNKALSQAEITENYLSEKLRYQPD